MRRTPLLLLLAASCGPSVGKSSDAGPTDAGPIDSFEGPFSDFPADPIVDPTGTPPPAGSAGTFGDPSTGMQTGGPCLTEPEVGTLYPRNWLRPRFSWVPAGTQNVFELRLSVASQVSTLVVYTTQTSWTMPADMWNALATHSVDDPITVSIRGATQSGGAFTDTPALGTKGNIAVAPVTAPGAIVYWTSSGGTGLRGFHIGEEIVHDIVRPADASTACVGCHSSTPGGQYVGFSASANAGDGSPATLALLSSDGTKQAPPFITASAQTLMARTQQEGPTFSKQHWQNGDHIAVTDFVVSTKTELAWTDLETQSTAQNTGWGVLARNGDSGSAASATFAHTTDTLLYTSAAAVGSGVQTTQGDLMTVPFNNRAGGNATPVSGAATTTYNEYYPTFSPDDQMIAFNRVAQDATSYNNANAELFAIPAAGGVPIRLSANDPPACTGKTSPGVTNSWPKWAPASETVGTKTYYWLTFSSTRSANARPQLYVTPVIVQGNVVSTFPSLYLWNQPADENNHTPAWDDFGIVQ